jgi:hypothetical protein
LLHTSNKSPTKKILGLKFHLSVYNLSREKKDNWWNRSLRTIGEEPVIFDEYLTEKTRAQLQLYLHNKGYYNGTVNDTVLYNKKKAKVIYTLDLQEPYRINSIKYRFEDTTVMKFILADTLNSLLKTGDNFDVDVLSAERDRIEKILKDRGFYNFAKEYIFYQADSSKKFHKVDVNLVVKKYRQLNVNGSFTEIPHPKYRIGNVYIITCFDAKEALANPDEFKAKLDTIVIDGITILFDDKQNVKPGVVISSNFILPSEYYKLSNVSQSYRNLSSLQLFRLVTIDFTEPENQEDKQERTLDCTIQLTPFVLQSYSIELEGTNSSGNIGGGGNLVYQHRNLFMGAENFDMRFKGALETIKENTSTAYGNMIELGAEANLSIPKFLLPFRTEQFIKKFNPKTTLKLAYNFQRRPDYVRTVANASFGYIWKGNKYLPMLLIPLKSTWLKSLINPLNLLIYLKEPIFITHTSLILCLLRITV